MKRLLVLLVLPVLAAVARAGIHVDDAGRRVEFSKPPLRVVTLAPNLTEFVYAVGAGATLVGTMDTSDYPEAAKHVERIGNYQRLDVERILSLKPDVVLVWQHGNQGRELGQFEAAGIPLFYVEPRRIDDVATTLERIGALLGHEREGQQHAAAYRQSIDELRGRYAKASPVSVFFQVWSQPLMTLNGQHLTSDLLALCGGRNVFAALPALAPQISVESVVAADPEAFFTARESGGDTPAWRRDPQAKAFRQWHDFRSLQAVSHGWMFSVSGDLVTRQGPRSAEGARAFCSALDEVRREKAPAKR
jgi:iron complex transport system substrate-binding protein